jgi:hypothetical protein
MSKKLLHIVKREDGWGVRTDGSTRDRSHHDTQADAIEAARKIARDQRGEVIIHGRDGHIVSRDSYGGDYAPPRASIPATRGKAIRSPLADIKKAIASLSPDEQAAIRKWLNSIRQRKDIKPKSSARRPDFSARQKAIFGDRLLSDSQAVLQAVRADRF